MNPNKQKQLSVAKTVKRIANIALNLTIAGSVTVLVVIAACRLIELSESISQFDNLGVVVCCGIGFILTVSYVVIVEAERKIEDIKNPPADF